MYMRNWNEDVTKIVSNNHLFIIDLLNFINLIPSVPAVPVVPAVKKLTKIDKKILHDFTQQIRKIKGNSNKNQLKLLNVITGTKLKEHILRLKSENIDYMEQYQTITSNYIKLINGEFSDNNSYSEQVVDSFNYFYSTLIMGKTYNREYGISDAKLSDLISIEEFRREWSLHSSCPYCDITQLEFDSSSVDHFFPKKKYPLLSIYPSNLVVSCTACNDRLKKDELNIPCAHPYYDNVETFFSFHIDNDRVISLKLNPSLSSTEEAKINNYLNLFKIRERYNTNGKIIIEDLEKNIRKNLVKELRYMQDLNYQTIFGFVEKELLEQLRNLNSIKMARSFVKLQIDYINQLLRDEEYKEDLSGYLNQLYCSS